VKKMFLLSILLFLAACGSVEYNIVEKEYNDQGGKSTVRLIMDDPTEDDIEEAVKELYTEEFFGSASVHAYIHNPGNDEYGELIAMAKYARSDDGLAQVGVEEIDNVYVEWEG